MKDELILNCFGREMKLRSKKHRKNMTLIS